MTCETDIITLFMNSTYSVPSCPLVPAGAFGKESKRWVCAEDILVGIKDLSLHFHSPVLISFKWSFPKCLAVEQAILEKKKNMSKKLWCKEFQTCCKQLPYILVSLLASFFYIILKFSLGPIWDAMKFRARTAGVKTLLGIENNNLENFLSFFSFSPIMIYQGGNVIL